MILLLVANYLNNVKGFDLLQYFFRINKADPIFLNKKSRLYKQV